MKPQLCLPRGVSDLVQAADPATVNPGLWLDKYVSQKTEGDDQHSKSALLRVCAAQPDKALLNRLNQNREAVLGSLHGHTQIHAKTKEPMTLHLARAAALENAGICLHPIYGFAYLPGSGIKGMARAYAETVWLAQEADAQELEWKKRMILDVFGNEHDEPKKSRLCRGGVIFHDAYPTEWPTLELDIVNVHHPKYYQGKCDTAQSAPTDCDNPIPSYFLTIMKGQRFIFDLTSTSCRVAKTKLEHARMWLEGALMRLGAGAKTNAGYGRFTILDIPNTPRDHSQSSGIVSRASDRALERTYDLTLISPGFFAGAYQDQRDCDLRVPELRGMLRWWWRTMHSAHVTPALLHRMENCVWGDTEESSPISLEILDRRNIEIGRYDFKEAATRELLPHLRAKNDLTRPQYRKVQGLFYMSYGMNDHPEASAPRWFVKPGACWSVRMSVRRTSAVHGASGQRVVLDKELIQSQAELSLHLLAALGGIGAKSRRGFGSFGDLHQGSYKDLLNSARSHASQFRDSWRSTVGEMGFSTHIAPMPPDSCSIDGSLVVDDEIPTQFLNYLTVLDIVGFCFQEFASIIPDRRSLGLPRLKHAPPRSLVDILPSTDPEQIRYASPLIISLAKRPNQSYWVRLLYFTAPRLSDAAATAAVKSQFPEFLKNLHADLSTRPVQTPAVLPTCPLDALETEPGLPQRGKEVDVKVVKVLRQSRCEVSYGEYIGYAQVDKLEKGSPPIQIGESLSAIYGGMAWVNEDEVAPQFWKAKRSR